jgi:acyl carrier protein
MEQASVIQRVQDFVREKFPLARKRVPSAKDDLLQTGIVDSLGVLDLVAFLEKEFGLTISDDELTPENFSSIEQIATFVSSKHQASAGRAG